MRSKFRLFITVTTILFCLFLTECGGGDSEPRLYLNSTTIPYLSDKMLRFHVGDLDADGEDEFIGVSGGKIGVAVCDFSREAFLAPMAADIRSPYWILDLVPLQADTLPGLEYAISLRDLDGDSAWIEIRSLSRNLTLCRTEAIVGENRDDKKSREWSGTLWDGDIDKCLIAEFDGDPDVELVVVPGVGYDCYPRGIFVYDYPSGKLKWKFISGANFGDVLLADADHDGRQEIYCKSAVTGNACEKINDIGDSSSVVLAIDHRGQVIWRDDLQDIYQVHSGDLRLADCDQDDTLELFYNRIQLLGDENDYDNHIRILEKHRATDGKLLIHRTFDPEQSFTIFDIADIDLDGKQELLTSDSVTIMDTGDLRKIKSAGRRFFNVVFIDDISPVPDGFPEIGAVNRDTLLIFDRNLNQLSQHVFSSAEKTTQVRAFRSTYGKSYIGAIVTTKRDFSNETDTRLAVLEVSDSPPFSQSLRTREGETPWTVIAITFFIGLLCGWAVFAAFFAKSDKSKRKSAHLDYDKLLTVINTFDHGQMAGKNLNRVALLAGNFPDEPGTAAEIIPRLDSAMEAYRSYTSNQLDNLINHGRRFTEFRTSVDKLIRTKKCLDGISSSAQVSEDRDKITSAVEDIKSAIRELRAELHKHFSCDLVRRTAGVLDVMTGRLAEEKVEIEDVHIRGDIRRRVLFADGDFDSILEELVNNACHAMKATESKTLRFDIAIHDSQAVFVIKDTGPGIKIENTEKLFARGYSTKENGSGYGLWYIRQAASKYGGAIDIRNRKDGRGAEVIFTLKVVENG